MCAARRLCAVLHKMFFLLAVCNSWAPQLTPSASRSTRAGEIVASVDDRGKVLGGSAVAAVTGVTVAATVGINGIFGVLDNTADELADLFGVDDVPPMAVSAIQALRPVYTPLKAVTPSCTAALFPEFNEMV